MISKPEREKLRELEANATKGPWLERFWHGPIDGELSVCSQGPIYTKTSENIVKVRRDAALITIVRNALPKLLDTIDQLESDNAAMREQLDVMICHAYDLAPDHSCVTCQAAEDAWKPSPGSELLERVKRLEEENGILDKALRQVEGICYQDGLSIGSVIDPARAEIAALKGGGKS